MDVSNTQPVNPSQSQDINPTIQPSQPTLAQPQQPYIEPKKPRSKLKIILGIIGVLVLLMVVIFGYLIFQGAKDAPQVQQKVTDFLQYVSNNNLEAAYSLTSTQFKEATPREDFTKGISLLKAQYSGFKEQAQTGFFVEANTGQPTLYKYSGIITYIDGDQGELAAALVKEDGDWKILSINVNIDIKRLEKFQQSDSNSVMGASTER